MKRIYKCDRCKTELDLSTDILSELRRLGWINFRIQETRFQLCPHCAYKLEQFLTEYEQEIGTRRYKMEEVQYSKEKDSICKGCKFYTWIDSGYGYCRRYPPKVVNVGKWWRPKIQINYQLVEWCRRTCGEFIPKGTKKRG